MVGVKKVFVTGVTGLLGTNLVNQLLADHYHVVGLLRNPARYIGRQSENLRLLKGDLCDDFSNELHDVETVVHIAAQTAQNILNYEPYRKVNYEATKSIYRAAVNAGVRRFIFISTANTSGFGSKENLGFEEHAMRKPFTQSFYALSKKEAEDFLLNQNDDIEIKILSPTFMLGANDVKPSSGRIIQMGLGKKILFYPPGGKNFVDVRDVVQAIIKSFTQGKDKDKWLICNENLSYKAFFSKLNQVNGQNPLMIKIPKSLLLGIGFLGDLMRKLKVKTDLCSTNMQSLCIYNYYTNEKSKQDLGVKYTEITQAIEEASRYFKTSFPKIKANR